MTFPARLHHQIPGWVEDGATIHVRIRGNRGQLLVRKDQTEALARGILEAARFYHEKQRWFCRLFVLMPDHAHAILAFPRDQGMSATIGAWKSFLTKRHGVNWQDGFFDHRLRSRREADDCWHYIRQNPVRAGLVANVDEWPWVWWPTDVAVPE
jgi:REP element-mobilizing transposase RayT